MSFGGGDRRRLVAASSVARRARQHLRTAFAVHAGARLTGTGKKEPCDSSRRRRRASIAATTRGRIRIRGRLQNTFDHDRVIAAMGEGAPRARSGAYLGHLLSLVFCLAFDRETANVIFPSRSGYALCRQRRVGIDRRDACVCAMDGAPRRSSARRTSCERAGRRWVAEALCPKPFRRALFSSCQVMLNQPGFCAPLGN